MCFLCNLYNCLLFIVISVIGAVVGTILLGSGFKGVLFVLTSTWENDPI